MREDQPAERLLRILASAVPDQELTLGFGWREQALESLALTRVWFLIRKEFGVDVPVSWLRQCPTPGDLLARIRAESADPDGAPDTASGTLPAAEPPAAEAPGATAAGTADPGAGHEPFALTDLQQAYLVAKDPQFGTDPIGCHVYREFEVDALDVPALEAAWRRVVGHHDMLRAVITPDGRQRVQEHAELPPLAVGGPEHAAGARERLSHRRYRPGEWPMHTVEVSHDPGGRSVVHLSIDVLFIDGHGLGVLLDDWWHCYRDPGHRLTRPEPTVRDCVLELAAQQRSPRYRAALAYWTERLTGLPDGPDTVAPPGDEPRRSTLSATVDRAQWQALGRLAAAWEVSPTSLVLTLFAEAFGRQRDARPLSLVLTTSHRSRLPAEADDLVGPFTSSLVLPLPATLDRPLQAAAAEVHRGLWEGLDHAAVSGVSALRALRAKDRTAPPPSLPVVFTSLLGSGRAGADGFAGAVRHAVSQTTGVALDHQMWERDGALHLRWDYVTGQFPPGGPAVLFAAFVNALRALGDRPPEHRALNELQQAYFVPRAVSASAPWDGCQVHHSFEVDDLDLGRLEDAWLRLVRAHPVLRTVVTHDGRLAVHPGVPDAWQIPVVDLAPIEDPEAYLADLQERMAGRALPLGRGPQSELLVTLGGGGAPDLVHLTTDLTVLDGPSIHQLVRELFRLYADPFAEPVPGAGPGQGPADGTVDGAVERDRLRQNPERPAQVEHWRARVAGLPAGPAVLPARGEPARRRFEGRLTGWRAVGKAAERAGLRPDDLLAAAFSEALAEHHPVPFALPVVRWTDGSARLRPGEFTALSWVTRDDAGLGLWEQAAAFRRVLDEDGAADGVSGLGELRRRVMRERRDGSFDLPVVYTGLLDLADRQLPDGVRLGPWLTCTPDVALDCIAIDEGDELRYYWDATEAQFPAGRLAAMFERYRQLLEGLVAGPGRGRGPDPERGSVARSAFPADRQVQQLFEEQAALRPGAVAVRWSGGTMSYAELNRRANRIAWALREQGVGPGTPVGISLPRGPEMVAAVHGVLKAGGFYVPLEPGLPEARAGAIVQEAGIALVVGTEPRTGWALPPGVRLVPADAPGHPEHDPEPVGTVDDTAYVIFTSGSTGRPKGVAVAHRPLLNLLDWCVRTFGFGPHDVGLCVTSLGFDLSVFDILGLLGHGASLYVADEREQRDPNLLLDILLREPVTFWNSAPTTLNQLAPLFPGRLGAPGTDSLRLVFLSGDYTPLPLPGEVRRLFPRTRIISLGGATEATVWSNWFEVGAIDPAWRSIPYGRAIDNARYYILDDLLRPCPAGVEGDLHIGGDCLAQGYHGQPELTRERFVPDPFSDRPGARMYRTGDRASFFPDGVICFLGRADSQVKIRGFRVEPAEVEHRLRSFPGVVDVVALARPDRTGDRRLVAYVVAADGSAPSVAELRRYAAQTLPDYMVPNVVAFVDTFPATANGKLDRDALPWPVEPGSTHRLSVAPARPEPTAAPAVAGPVAGPVAVAPPVVALPVVAPPAATAPAVDRAGLAAEIAAIFAELLGLTAVAPAGDIWDQGATSFTMVQVSGVLQERYGWQVPVSALLADPTVSGIAAAVVELAGATEPAAVPGQAGGREPLPVRMPAAAVAAVPEPAAVPRADPPRVDFFSAADREAFKQARWDLRRPAPGAPVIALDGVPVAAEHLEWRASRREFAAGPVPAAAFGRLLGLLRESATDGRRRRLYPSAGDTYAVQVYVHVRPGGVEGVPAGLYYHHPVEHTLHLVNAAPELDRSMHFVYNRPVFDAAGFELYLFGQDDAVEPLYGADAERFELIEAGYLGQLLLLGQPFAGVGLCPVGTLALDALRTQLGLTASHRYLHAFLGGPLAGAPAQAVGGELPLFVPPVSQALPVPQALPVAQAPTAQTAPASPPADAPEVVVVGAAGRFPGADDLDAYWHNLSRGVRSLVAAPEQRRAHLPADAPAGGYLADVDTFDSLLFRVAPAEAAGLDPQSRLLLHTVWECLDDAGHTPRSLAAAGRVGVFCGAMWQDYQHVGADLARAGHGATISGTASEAANRISHFFDFDGPSLAVDTSCSSSLAALHLAVESLRRGECDSAVVAAANLLTHPYHLDLLSGLGLLAERLPDGAFDAAAPGWSPGEGVAAVLLRTGPAAERDGDTAVAVVEATRVGHPGGAGRFGTPQAGPLARSIGATLDAAGLLPADVDYVECAAAGALLADAAEVEALGRVFAGGSVAVGTVKPNIGHLEAAAGLSQLVKVLLQFRHGQIAPTVLAAGTGAVARWPEEIRPAGHLAFWPGAGPARALVNSVGATGSYGHVVLRGCPPVASGGPAAAAGRYAFPLTAQTDGRLADLAGLLHRRLGTGPAPEPGDVAHTLQSGRVHQGRRVVVEAATTEELRSALAGVHRGTTPGTNDPALAAWLAGAEIDWTPYRPAGARRVPLPGLPFRTERHVLPGFATAAASAAAPASAVPGVSAVPGAPGVPAVPAERLAGTAQYLRGVYAGVSGVPLDRLDLHTPLEDYGLSSAQVVQLNARLAADLGDEVPSTLFFAHRDLAGVAGELAGLPGASRLASAPVPDGERSAPVSARVSVPVSVPASVSSPAAVLAPRPPAPAGTGAADDGRIAVVGLAGRYPQADDLDAFWRNLLAGRDLVTPLPEGRRRPGDGPEPVIGGFLDDVAGFDPLFFGITPRAAAAMDPQERLFLQTAWHTLEDAGWTRARLRERHGGRVGVFVGSMYNEYPFLGLEAGHPVGSAIAGIANRVSYVLDLNGPSLTVDTMCSSSLTALHLAVAALRRGECEAALVGGVNLSLHPNKFAALRELGMASSDHRCRSFGAGGDGFVPGEGVGAVLLKPLAAAVADGDRIHAVVLGTAVNHDGKTNGYTVPNPVAQGELVAAALRDAGIGPADIGYVEAHGTGTPLGDPIELDGLARVFASAGTAPGRLPIGSVKSGIGHLEAAAGIAGLTKVLLQFRHETLAPSLHADRLNPNVDWARSPFRVQREAAPWPAGLPRRAGISAFGAGGTNAHVVVEAHPAQPAEAAVPGPQLVVLSARTEEQLLRLAERWTGMLRGEPAGAGAGSLADLAHTSRLGREAMRVRLAVVARSTGELLGRLERFLAGGDPAVLRGRAGAVPAPDPGPDASLEQLARHWVDGGTVDWSRLDTGPPRVAGLPGYPFAALPCWVAADPADGADPTDADPTDADPGGPDPAVRQASQPQPQPQPQPFELEPVVEPAQPQVPLLARAWRAGPPAGPSVGVASVADPSADRSVGTVLCLLADARPGLAEALAPARLVTLRQGLDFTDAAGARTAVREVLDRTPVTGLLDLCALAEEAGDEHDAGPWTARLAILQQVLAARPAAGLRVLQVTSGLLGMPGARPDRRGARMSGFVRSLGAEYPWARATVLDTDRPELLAELRAVWDDPGPYGEACLRGGERFGPALVPVTAGTTSWQPAPEKVYLVTGGTRGLGALTARHLVRRGARRIAVLGVRPLPPRHAWTAGGLTGPEAEAVAGIRELERLGARVMTHTGPLSRRDELSAFLAEVRTALGPIGGVVHCAGRGSAGPAPFLRMDVEDIRRVLEPKGDGLDALLSLTGGDPLDFLVLFSSVSAAAPALAVGVADYAAANAYLDLAARHHAGARAVNWPVWRDTGGGTGHPDAAAAVGLDALGDEAGLAVLDQVLDGPDGVVLLPCPVRPGAPAFDPETVLYAHRPAAHRPAAPGPVPPAPVPAGPSGAPGWLVELFAEALAIPVGELEQDAEFGDLGVESVLLGELVTRIEAATGRPLEPTALFDHPTLERLGAHLAATGAVGPPDEAPRSGSTGSAPASEQAPAAPAPAPADPTDSDPADGARAESDPAARPDRTDDARPGDRIAVVGMACRFPGAPDLGAFWELLRTGGCAVTEVPPGRWDTERLYRAERAPGRSISKWGGFVDGLEDFDPDHFGMTDGEARNLDPAIRLTMEATAACLRDAGYPDEELRGADVGIFMGARMSGYRRRIGVEGSATGLGGDQNFVAARISHQYDFRGPALVVDSACSSALVAVQAAIRSLQAGESDLALAGGVEVLLDEEPYLEFSVARALSPRGRCATFDRDADGFVPGEGCGILLLKTLDRALADGDRIHAVLDAVTVGNDGRTMGLTTPNPAAQAQVVRRALARAGIRAEQVGLLEAHGTGTMIGDPIELRALTDVFREHTALTGFCTIGSVKSNLGHLLSAAGIAGLIKALLAVEHGEIPPTLFCEHPNPRFDFAASPFVPGALLTGWNGPRVAGVSAFGLGGTNAHAIASQAPAAARPRRTSLPAPVFHRRRLWWDRPDTAPAAAAAPAPAPVPVPAPVRAPQPVAFAGSAPLVASVLDLTFRSQGKAAV